LLPLRRLLRVLRLRQNGRRADDGAKENSKTAGQESRNHLQSVDAEKRAAKQHDVKQL
jgi:hypothetical protein